MLPLLERDGAVLPGAGAADDAHEVAAQVVGGERLLDDDLVEAAGAGLREPADVVAARDDVADVGVVEALDDAVGERADGHGLAQRAAAGEGERGRPDDLELAGRAGERDLDRLPHPRRAGQLDGVGREPALGSREVAERGDDDAGGVGVDEPHGDVRQRQPVELADPADHERVAGRRAREPRDVERRGAGGGVVRGHPAALAQCPRRSGSARCARRRRRGRRRPSR